MKIRPIIFKKAMVHGLQAGRKTQTRRILEPKGPYLGLVNRPAGDRWWFGAAPGELTSTEIPVRYAVGDLLYVREAWRKQVIYYNTKPFRLPKGVKVWYEADGKEPDWADSKIQPSIFLPRRASRITLEVTNVRIQRLQEITGQDAMAEGIVEDDGSEPDIWYCPGAWELGVSRMGSNPVEAFRHLWTAINGKPAWEANPQVVAVTFKVHHCNVDEFRRAA